MKVTILHFMYLFSIIEIANLQFINFKLNVSDIPFTEYWKVRNIKEVQISGAIDSRLFRFNKIASIEAAEQNVQIFPAGFVQDLTNLQSMVFDSNGLEVIELGAFKNLPKLTYILIMRNNIQMIGRNVFNYPSLRIQCLVLSSNKIKYIEDGAFDNMEELKELHISYNQLSEWNLKWTTTPMPNLNRINLSNNQLENVPNGMFKHCDALVSFSLAENKLKELRSEMFDGNFVLTQADFYSNNISWIDPKLIIGEKAGEEDKVIVELDNNLLERFPKKLLNGLRGSKKGRRVLQLEGNLFSCSCKKEIQEECERLNIDLKNLEEFVDLNMDCPKSESSCLY